jgi:hypothetical protein
MFKRNVLPYLASSQIWPNIFVDHCHFGYITKLNPKKKKKRVGRVGIKVLKRKIGRSCWVVANYNSLACLSCGPQQHNS